MLYSKDLLFGLALYLLLEEASVFLLPERVRQTRDLGWSDSEVPLKLSELTDRAGALPGDSEDGAQERGTRLSQHSSFPAPLERLSVPHHHHKAPRRKPKDKKRRVTVPLDTIGGSLLSNLGSKMEEPEEHWEYYSK